MATMSTKVYDALRSVNVPEDKARAAASALGSQDTQFTRVHGRLDQLETRLEGRIDQLETRMDGRFTLLQWMLALNIAMTLAISLKMC